MAFLRRGKYTCCNMWCMSPRRHLKKKLQIQKVLKTVSLTTPKKLHLNMAPSYSIICAQSRGGLFSKTAKAISVPLQLFWQERTVGSGVGSAEAYTLKLFPEGMKQIGLLGECQRPLESALSPKNRPDTPQNLLPSLLVSQGEQNQMASVNSWTIWGCFIVLFLFYTSSSSQGLEGWWHKAGRWYSELHPLETVRSGAQLA